MLVWTDFSSLDGLWLRLVTNGSGIQAVQFHPQLRPRPEGTRDERHPLLCEAIRQLQAYFARDLRVFDLPLDLRGTEFQLRVWRQLTAIPYGETRSYAQIAAAIGAERAVRAVGAANGANPIPIIVPCHRVVGSNGKMTGYGGGLPLKRKLLELEGAGALALRWESEP